MVRNSEKSRFQFDGPRKALRPVLPHALPGCEKTDGSYHCSFGPASPKPGLASPVTLIVCWPPTCCSRPLSPPMVNGVPDSQEPMPLTCQFFTTYATGFELFRRERQLVDEAHLQHVRTVVAGPRVVAVELRRLVPGQTDPAVVVGLVERLAERVGALEQQAVLERPVQRHLQRVVARLRARRPIAGCRRSRLREELAVGVAAATRRSSG